MFELKIWKWPGEQMKRFLKSSQIAEQYMPDELDDFMNSIKDPRVVSTPKSIFYSLFIKSFPKIFATVIALNILGKLIFFLGLWGSENILEEKHPLHILLMFAALFALSKCLRVVINYISCLYGEIISGAIGVFFFSHINRKILTVDLLDSNGSQFSSGNLKTLVVSDIGHIQRFFNGLISSVVPALTTVVVLGPFLWQRMGEAGLLALSTSFLLIPLTLLIVKAIHAFQKSIQSQEDDLTTLIGEWLTNVRLVRYLNLNSTMSESINRAIRKLVLLCCKQHSVVIVSDTLAMIWWMIPVIVLSIIAHSMETPYSIATLFGSIWILNQLNSEIKYIPFSIRNYANAKASLDRIKRFWSLPDVTNKLLPSVDEHEMTPFHPVKIHFRNVSLSLGSTQVFTDFNLSLDLRLKTFIIGEVGAGKSILLKAIVGEVAPVKGEIYIELENGHTHNLWQKNVYQKFRDYIGYVPQSPYLSNDMLKNNISLDASPDMNRLMDAIHFSQMIPDVGSLPSGVEEEIGEQGVNLSGGQKQRLSIARAFYMNREILIMDDPFSALDQNTENSFFHALTANFQSFIISTHRLSNIDKAEKVLLLEAGKILEYGKPDASFFSENARFFHQI